MRFIQNFLSFLLFCVVLRNTGYFLWCSLWRQFLKLCFDVSENQTTIKRNSHLLTIKSILNKNNLWLSSVRPTTSKNTQPAVASYSTCLFYNKRTLRDISFECVFDLKTVFKIKIRKSRMGYSILTNWNKQKCKRK